MIDLKLAWRADGESEWVAKQRDVHAKITGHGAWFSLMIILFGELVHVEDFGALSVAMAGAEFAIKNAFELRRPTEDFGEWARRSIGKEGIE